MKHCVLVLDGASGHPLEELDGKTCMEAALTPNLDSLAAGALVGTAVTVPEGMEPSSTAACSSILGYDPRRYQVGRGAIEAAAMGIKLGESQVAFRCNLVYVADGVMQDYSAGHIPSEESRRIISRLNEELGDDATGFHPGVSYRHILTLHNALETLEAECTPPHDIPGRPVEPFLPRGPGSERLLELMERSGPVLATDPVNEERARRGEPPANMIWLFWGGHKPGEMPAFFDVYRLRAAITSAVDLLGGLAELFSISRLTIPGVTDGPDNDYRRQAEGALAALADHDLVVIHVEAPDEAAHAGDARRKIEAIEQIDSQMVPLLTSFPEPLRILAMPDHPTPVALRTHVSEPVPFMLHGPGFESNGAEAFSEAQARATGLRLQRGWELMGRLAQ